MFSILTWRARIVSLCVDPRSSIVEGPSCDRSPPGSDDYPLHLVTSKRVEQNYHSNFIIIHFLGKRKSSVGSCACKGRIVNWELAWWSCESTIFISLTVARIIPCSDSLLYPVTTGERCTLRYTGMFGMSFVASYNNHYADIIIHVSAHYELCVNMNCVWFIYREPKIWTIKVCT